MQPASNTNQPTITLSISGMTCDGCARSVKKLLSSVSGAKNVEVDLAREQASIGGSASVEALIEAVEGAGFEARAE